MEKISIIHPSRGRCEMAFNTIGKWLTSASGKNQIEYILSIDITDSNCHEYGSNLDYLNDIVNDSVIHIKSLIGDNKTAIEAINNAAKVATGDLFIVVSDDFDCFDDWDLWLLEKLKDKSDFIVKTCDGIQPRLITLPIMDRAYYNRFGYVYFPEYLHMFCDTEMTEVGHLLGRVVDLNDEHHMFQHRHYITGLMEKDAINEKNDATWAQGEALFNSRKEKNFFIS